MKPTEAATTEPAAAAESAAAEPQRKAAPAPPPRTALPSAADLLASASVPEFIAASRSTTAEPAAPAGPAAGTGSATQDAGRKRKAPPGPSPMLPPQIRRPNVVTEDAEYATHARRHVVCVRRGWGLLHVAPALGRRPTASSSGTAPPARGQRALIRRSRSTKRRSGSGTSARHPEGRTTWRRRSASCDSWECSVARVLHGCEKRGTDATQCDCALSRSLSHMVHSISVPRSSLQAGTRVERTACARIDGSRGREAGWAKPGMRHGWREW